MAKMPITIYKSTLIQIELLSTCSVHAAYKMNFRS